MDTSFRPAHRLASTRLEAILGEFGDPVITAARYAELPKKLRGQQSVLSALQPKRRRAQDESQGAERESDLLKRLLERKVKPADFESELKKRVGTTVAATHRLLEMSGLEVPRANLDRWLGGQKPNDWKLAIKVLEVLGCTKGQAISAVVLGSGLGELPNSGQEYYEALDSALERLYWYSSEAIMDRFGDAPDVALRDILVLYLSYLQTWPLARDPIEGRRFTLSDKHVDGLNTLVDALATQVLTQLEKSLASEAPGNWDFVHKDLPVREEILRALLRSLIGATDGVYEGSIGVGALAKYGRSLENFRDVVAEASEIASLMMALVHRLRKAAS